jgi:WD40 repeat protein
MASNDGKVRIWNAVSGASERVLDAGPAAVLDARYSPLGDRIAAAGADGLIHIWRLAGGDPLLLSGHDGSVNVLGFNAAGDRLVSGGKDGTVRVWDAGSGDPLVMLYQHKGSVSGVAFSPNGKAVVSGADDGLRVSACEVCGTFPEVQALTRIRPDVTLTAADRRRLGIGG